MLIHGVVDSDRTESIPMCLCNYQIEVSIRGM